MFRQLVPAIRATAVLALYTGIIFPLLMVGISQLLFPHQANGSLIKQSGQVVGSELLAQAFSKPEYFHPRPSAAGSGYAGEASGGTNLGPTSKKLIEGDGSFKGIKQLADDYRKENSLASDTLVPVDAVTRSSSGLDPHITPQNAQQQVRQIANTRRVPEARVIELLNRYTEPRDLFLLGEPRVNVLRLNIALDSELHG